MARWRWRLMAKNRDAKIDQIFQGHVPASDTILGTSSTVARRSFTMFVTTLRLATLHRLLATLCLATPPQERARRPG